MEEYRTIIVAAGAAIVVIIVVAILVAVVRRRRRARALQAPLPLIPFSPGSRMGTPPRPDPAVHPMTEPIVRPATPPAAWSAPVEDARPAGYTRAPYAPPPVSSDVARRSAPPRGTAATPLSGTAMPNDHTLGLPVDGTAVDGASVRYWRPADGTLQFLPGRLEVIAGHDAGQEIRFVRTPGPDGTRVTFGRAEGAPYRHIQLREPTVSRTHARMTLENGTVNTGAAAKSSGPNVGRWRLENLSATNPVVVNGVPLGADGDPDCSVALGEGDRIEMGEVVFRFHER